MDFINTLMRFPLSKTKQIEIRVIGHGEDFTQATAITLANLDMILRQLALLKEQLQADLAEGPIMNKQMDTDAEGR